MEGMLSAHSIQALEALPNIKREEWDLQAIGPMDVSHPGFSRTRRLYHLAAGVPHDTDATCKALRDFDARCRRRKYVLRSEPRTRVP